MTRDAVPNPPASPNVLMPVPAPTVPSATGPSLAAASAVSEFALTAGVFARIVDEGVVALEDDEVHRSPTGGTAHVGFQVEAPPQHGRLDRGRSEHTRHRDDGLERAELVDLHQPHGLAVAVDDVSRRRQWPGLDIGRHDHGHSGRHTAGRIHDRRVPDAHPGTSVMAPAGPDGIRQVGSRGTQLTRRPRPHAGRASWPWTRVLRAVLAHRRLPRAPAPTSPDARANAHRPDRP